VVFRKHTRSLHVASKVVKKDVTSNILMARTVKTAVFWDATLCSLIVTNVSEEISASIFRVEQ
jgi:hypothetical protein